MSVAFETVEDPARACAALMLGAAMGDGDMVLAGGSTPKAAYEHFVEAVKTVGLDLAGTTFWLGDERCVEPDDERSNFRMIKETLIDPLAGITEARVQRIRGELGADAAAEDYDRRLREADLPEFDLVLLGIGSDGHTASLFPQQSTLSERTRLAVPVPVAGLEPFVARVTLTVSALVRTPRVVFLASGEAKAEALASAFGPGAHADPAVPASLLVPEARQILVLTDRPAARLVSGGAR